jgi:hypothetical protein
LGGLGGWYVGVFVCVCVVYYLPIIFVISDAARVPFIFHWLRRRGRGVVGHDRLIWVEHSVDGIVRVHLKSGFCDFSRGTLGTRELILKDSSMNRRLINNVS